MPKIIITKEICSLIKKMLKEGSLPNAYAIADKVIEMTGIQFNKKAVGDINLGRRWFDPNEKYPINAKYAKTVLGKCCICGKDAWCQWKDGKQYCKRHYMQMYHHGKIIEKTIYDKNDYVEYDTYYELILRNIDGDEVARTLIDKEDFHRVCKYKWYCTKYENHSKYCQGTLEDGVKIRLHHFILGIKNISKTGMVVDHINGNSLDNRKSNLRIVTQKENMQNMKTENKVKGIDMYVLKSGKIRYKARLCNNYKTISLGTYDTLEEAQLARANGEKKYWSKK